MGCGWDKIKSVEVTEDIGVTEARDSKNEGSGAAWRGLKVKTRATIHYSMI